MLYYADTKLSPATEESKSTVKPARYETNEQLRARSLIYHTIIGLASIQHNGSMLIKLHETHDVLSVGVLFMLYNLFQKVCIVKPYATSFVSSR